MRKVIVNSTPLIALGKADMLKRMEQNGFFISDDLKTRIRRISNE